jgi:hypothetical protein
MRSRRLSFVLCFLLLTAACAHVDYIGRVYPPTSQIDLYFTEQVSGFSRT